MAEETTLISEHPEAVKDALQAAGMSRNSELTPAQRNRAEALASGQVEFATEDTRRAFVMRGTGERKRMANRNGPTKGEERLREVLLILKKFRRPITRAELNAKAEERGTLKDLVGDNPWGLGDVMSENATAETVLDGYRIKREGRGKYAAEKVGK